MSIREEQCNKVCKILDDVLTNRPTERDSLIVAVRKAFEALELFGNSEQLSPVQPEIIRCKDCKYYRWEIDMCDEPYSTAHNVVHEYDYCSKAERRTDG